MFPKHDTPQRHKEKEYCPLHKVKLQILAAMASVSGLRFIDSDVKFPLKRNAYKRKLMLLCEVFSSIGSSRKSLKKTSQCWYVNDESLILGLLFAGMKN